MERAHVVEPVAELDQQNADILAHCEEEFPEVLRRPLVLGHLFDLGEFGDAIDQSRDVGPEIALDLVDGR